jgi:hypothetical protein
MQAAFILSVYPSFQCPLICQSGKTCKRPSVVFLGHTCYISPQKNKTKFKPGACPGIALCPNSSELTKIMPGQARR